jgi:hypothetical protein
VQVHRSRSVFSDNVHSTIGICTTQRSLRLSLLPTRQRVRPPGLMSVYELPAVPGFGLRNILVLWSQSPICIRMATARLATLPSAMIDPVATHLKSLRAEDGSCDVSGRCRGDRASTSRCRPLSAPRLFESYGPNAELRAAGLRRLLAVVENGARLWRLGRTRSQ